MSDTKEIIYNSPSMGRVRLIRNDSEAVWARPSSVEALEVRFREMAARRSSTEVFHLRPSDFDAIAAELERRAGDWKNTAQPLDAFRREYLGVFPPRLTSTTTAGADDVVDAMQYAREGLDKLARRDAAMSLTNDEMRAECSRRNLHRASTETLTDDQLRAECERRGLALIPKDTMGRKFVGETGPGIVGVKVEKDTSAWVLLEDLVAADE